MKIIFWMLLGAWIAFESWFGIASLFDKDRDNQLMEQGVFFFLLLTGAIFFLIFHICLEVFGKKEPPKP